ncbi:MAG: hypothetical protein LBE09_02035 [Christensenellaceae bacterium]|jgi:hypothetical protein|nr:hypothetical protein [Christensenellaceae bacterium]
MDLKSNYSPDEMLLDIIIDLNADEIGELKRYHYCMYKNEVNVPGFRPGKAPMQNFFRVYGIDKAYQEIAFDNLLDAVKLALEEASYVAGLIISSDDTFTFNRFERGDGGITFVFGFEVENDVDLDLLFRGLGEKAKVENISSLNKHIQSNIMATYYEPRATLAENGLLGDDIRLKHGDFVWLEYRIVMPDGAKMHGDGDKMDFICMLIGYSNIPLPGLEGALLGRSIGDKISLDLVLTDNLKGYFMVHDNYGFLLYPTGIKIRLQGIIVQGYEAVLQDVKGELVNCINQYENVYEFKECLDLAARLTQKIEEDINDVRVAKVKLIYQRSQTCEFGLDRIQDEIQKAAKDLLPNLLAEYEIEPSLVHANKLKKIDFTKIFPEIMNDSKYADVPLSRLQSILYSIYKNYTAGMHFDDIDTAILRFDVHFKMLYDLEERLIIVDRLAKSCVITDVSVLPILRDIETNVDKTLILIKKLIEMEFELRGGKINFYIPNKYQENVEIEKSINNYTNEAIEVEVEAIISEIDKALGLLNFSADKEALAFKACRAMQTCRRFLAYIMRE